MPGSLPVSPSAGRGPAGGGGRRRGANRRGRRGGGPPAAPFPGPPACRGSTRCLRPTVSGTFSNSAATDRPGGLSHLPARRQADREAGAASRFALYRNIAAHHLAKLLAERQPQTGAVVLPGGGAIHLREGLEQLAQVLPADPDAGIADVHFGPLAIPNAHLVHRRCSGVSVRISATRVSNGRSEWRCPPLCAGAAPATSPPLR